MSITDELRKWVRDGKGSLLAIADRIDAEHERSMSRAGQLLADAESDRDYNYANWQECKQKVLQHNITMDELSAEIERLKDELLHCIELPKDADGVPIHVGDVMDTERFGVVEVEGFIHNAIAFNVYDPQPARICTVPANQCRHHHAPTVEDVLRQFLGECEHASMLGYTDMPQDIFDTYAAKLRLAEGEDA